MPSLPRGINKRIDNLEFRVGEVEKSTQEIKRQLEPIHDSLIGLVFVSKAVGFVTVLASCASALLHLLKH
jgi:hypothetical protein